VLDRAGDILAAAGQQGAGLLHAEALSISQVREAGQADRIHTIVVTFGPCNHHGRTPPRTEAILATSAEHVVIDVADPNPKVAAGGAERLRQAGLLVEFLKTDAKLKDLFPDDYAAALTNDESLAQAKSRWTETLSA
jgi:diaminohydroxyphosphoribosylaminopyrimidine deaminase / 5-amino-6-(5-phosphoribosylamino)uracil reductase